VEAISTSSIHRLRAGHWRDESVSTEFHELRREFIPRRRKGEKRSRAECQRWAKAACSVHGSDFDKLNPPPAGWPLARRVRFREASFRGADFHELRREFIPRRFKDEKRSRTKCQRWAKAACSVHGSPAG